MDYNELKDQVVEWADDKGIFDKATPMTQFFKTQEEVTELGVALNTFNRDETVDAIGDIVVTLIIQCEMQGLDLLECLSEAYNQIANRTGKMVDGVFVKDE